MVVVGGGGAGRRAAQSARATDTRATVLVVDRSPVPAAVPQGVEFHGGLTVTDVDPIARRVQTDHGALGFDTLVLAPGGERDFAGLPGLQGAKNVGPAAARRAARRGRPVVMLGGGGGAAEAARALAKGGARVTVVVPAGRLLPGFSATAEAAVRERLLAVGVRLCVGVAIAALQREGERVRAVTLSDGSELPAAALLVFGDERGATALARRAGARTTREGLLVIDARGETSLPGVFACGRAVAVPHALSHAPVPARERPLRRRTARVAGVNAAGGAARLGPALGTAVVGLGRLVVARTGHPPPTGGDGTWCDHFDLEGATWRITGCIEGHERKLWGIELVGPRDARPVVDCFAAGMLGGATLAAFSELDFASDAGRVAIRIAERARGLLLGTS